MKIISPQSLLVNDIQDLYSAEKQILKALPKMIDAAQGEDLKAALIEHQQQTEDQVARLEQVKMELGIDSLDGKMCHGMAGILLEGDEAMTDADDPSALELALLEGSEKVENYEIVGYTNAAMLAKELDYPNTAKLLNTTLKEEMKAADRLAGFSKSNVRDLG